MHPKCSKAMNVLVRPIPGLAEVTFKFYRSCIREHSGACGNSLLSMAWIGFHMKNHEIPGVQGELSVNHLSFLVKFRVSIGEDLFPNSLDSATSQLNGDSLRRQLLSS